jgi:succinoglycan biosynthesis protein ExoM
MSAEVKHISVCICTFKRPALLWRLLSSLERQLTEALFDYSVVIVDNDRAESARQTVELYACQSKIPICYHIEPEQNIALARNKAVENAKGDFIAFIDDDEFPNEDWLLNLYKAFHRFPTDGVLGPVKPYFETEPPQWIIRGRLCERKSFETGAVIRNPKYTRTGNVLLNRRLFVNKENRFDPLFGKTGGEDVDFFERMIRESNVFVWCNEASVNEIVPPQRFRRSFFLKKALLRGVANAQKVPFCSLHTLKSFVAIGAYTLLLPALLLVRHDLFMKYLIKDCDHIGKLLALCGFKVLKARAF